jgi:hypothetical protein
MKVGPIGCGFYFKILATAMRVTSTATTPNNTILLSFVVFVFVLLFQK